MLNEVTIYKIEEACELIHRSEYCLLGIGRGSALDLLPESHDLHELYRSSVAPTKNDETTDVEAIEQSEEKDLLHKNDWNSLLKSWETLKINIDRNGLPEILQILLKWKAKYWSEKLEETTEKPRNKDIFADNGIAMDNTNQAYVSDLPMDHFFCITTWNLRTAFLCEYEAVVDFESIQGTKEGHERQSDRKKGNAVSQSQSIAESLPGVVSRDEAFISSDAESGRELLATRTVLPQSHYPSEGVRNVGLCQRCGARDRPNFRFNPSDRIWVPNLACWKQYIDWQARVGAVLEKMHSKVVIIELEVDEKDEGLKTQLEWTMSQIYQFPVNFIKIGSEAVRSSDYKASTVCIKANPLLALKKMDELLEKKPERRKYAPVM